MGTVTKKLSQRKIFLFPASTLDFFLFFFFHLPFPPFPASRGRCRDYQIAPQGNWNIHSLEVNRDPWFRERFWVMRSPILKYFECKAISRGCPSPYTPPHFHHRLHPFSFSSFFFFRSTLIERFVDSSPRGNRSTVSWVIRKRIKAFQFRSYSGSGSPFWIFQRCAILMYRICRSI